MSKGEVTLDDFFGHEEDLAPEGPPKKSGAVNLGGRDTGTLCSDLGYSTIQSWRN
jgi:hypothetical protein